MATSSSINDTTLGSDEVLVSLKATAHLRSHDHHSDSDIVVAGAGIVDMLGNAIQSYEIGKNVLVLMQETSQGYSISRVKAHASHICLMPPHMSYGDAVSRVYPFVSGITILQTQPGVAVPLPSTANTVPTALILGGERALGNALTQLLHVALPRTSILVACRFEDTSPPERLEEVVRPFCCRALENGASYGIEAAAPDLLQHLQAAIDAYGASLQLILDFGGEVTGWPQITGMLDDPGRLVTCSRVHVGAGTD